VLEAVHACYVVSYAGLAVLRCSVARMWWLDCVLVKGWLCCLQLVEARDWNKAGK